jgi:hypothetical protein
MYIYKEVKERDRDKKTERESGKRDYERRKMQPEKREKRRVSRVRMRKVDKYGYTEDKEIERK